jgi:methionyl-tRNA formyltransferase
VGGRRVVPAGARAGREGEPALRLLFAGTPEPAVPSLEALLGSRHDVVAVLTRPDARAGRGRKVSRSPVAERADAAGVPVLQPRSPREPEFLEQLAELAVDCAPVVAYGALVPQAALDLPAHGWVNLHFSLLPAWRGAAPVQHAIMAGDEVTGASTFRLEAGLDTGPVFGTVTETIGAHDTAGDLLGRLSVSGAGLLVATLDGIAAGRGDQPRAANRASRRPGQLGPARPRRRPPRPRGHACTRGLDDLAWGPAAARPGRAGRERPGARPRRDVGRIRGRAGGNRTGCRPPR